MEEFTLDMGTCLWCEQPATGSHHGCYHHDPDFAELRKQRASTAAKSKGNAELRKLKGEVRGLIADIRSDSVDRNVGTAMLQGYRVLHSLIELERRIKETDELAAEIAAIKETVENEY